MAQVDVKLEDLYEFRVFLIENGKDGKFGATPILLIVLDDEHATHMKTAADKVSARGAHAIKPVA